MNLKILTFSLIIVLSLGLVKTSAQINKGSDKIYVIYFKDKANTIYSVNKPLEFLSQKAVDRREKNGISISEMDFPVNSTYLDSLKNSGAQILFTSRWFNFATIKVDTSLIINKIVKMPFVSGAEIVFKGDVLDTGINKISYFNATSENYNYGFGYRQINMLNGDYLHKQGYAGDNVIIAVLDAGFWNVDKLSIFKPMFDQHRVPLVYSFVEGNDSVYINHTHGTIVLSVMAGNSPGKLVGTAPNATYLLLVSENGSSEYLVEEYAWISAAEMADSAGADVINSSLGYSDFDNDETNHSYAQLDGNTLKISRAADIAASKGIIVVNSAGNQGAKQWKYITAPADADSILTVGSVDKNRQYSEFSSQGPSADGNIKPNLVAMGEETVTTGLKEGELALVNGTSLSSPIIAGLMACMVDAFPDEKAMDIINAVQQSCSLYPDFNYKIGYGIPDFKVAYEILSLKNKQIPEGFKILKVYPNPFNKGVNFSYFIKDADYLYINLTDLTGRIVAEHKVESENNTFNKTILNINNLLRPGFYLLNITDGKTRVVEKMLAY